MTGLFRLPRLPTYLRRTPASSNQYLSYGCPTVAHFRTSRSFSRDSNGKALEVVVFPPLNWHREPWNWDKTIQTSCACSIKLAKVTQPPPETDLSSIILSQRHWQIETRAHQGSEPFGRFSISFPEPSFLLIRQHWGGEHADDSFSYLSIRSQSSPPHRVVNFSSSNPPKLSQSDLYPPNKP